jgi:hypothetical protein
VIPRDYITAWRARVPWVQDFQVEQDLIFQSLLETLILLRLDHLLHSSSGTSE